MDEHIHFTGEMEAVVPPEVTLQLSRDFGLQWECFNRNTLKKAEIIDITKYYGVKLVEDRDIAGMRFRRNGVQHIIFNPAGEYEVVALRVLHELCHVAIEKEGYLRGTEDQFAEEFLCTGFAIQALIPLHLTLPKQAVAERILPEDFCSGATSPARYEKHVPSFLAPVDAWRWATIRANVFNNAFRACSVSCDGNCLRCSRGRAFFKIN